MEVFLGLKRSGRGIVLGEPRPLKLMDVEEGGRAAAYQELCRSPTPSNPEKPPFFTLKPHANSLKTTLIPQLNYPKTSHKIPAT